MLESIIQVDAPVIFFACAVLLAAWRGGLGPGLYTTLVGVLIIDYFFMSPQGDLFGHTFHETYLDSKDDIGVAGQNNTNTVL